MAVQTTVYWVNYIYHSSTLDIKYGLLYNWYATTDARNIANNGWHVPTEAEWIALQTYLGGELVAGGKLKETGVVYWNTPNTGATNEVGFNARAGNYRYDDGTWAADYGEEGNIGMWWSSEEDILNRPIYGIILYNDVSLVIVGANFPGPAGDDPKNNATSIRLIKDSTSLSHGETGLYTGNNGLIYRTICVGTQEWLADNLAETLYRNLDSIPEVIDDIEWNALTTGALCAYNNDWTTVRFDIVSGYYIYYNDEIASWRKGVRAGDFVLDYALTPTGFEGEEDIDWKVVKRKT